MLKKIFFTITFMMMTFQVFGKELTLDPVNGTVVNDTQTEIYQVVIRSKISCHKMNIVTGSVTLSQIKKVTYVNVDNSGFTAFMLNRLNHSCDVFNFGKKWLKAKVVIYFPEVKKGLSFAFDRRKLSENEINSQLAKMLDKVLVSKAVDFY